MGAIKDVVDLATQLSESVQDRKFASDLMKIIQLINTIQSEQASLTESNIELMTENSKLKQSITALESDITKLEQQISGLQNPTSNISSDISEEENKILLFLAKNKHITADQVSHSTSLDLTRTEYWLGKLSKEKKVSRSLRINAPALWNIGQSGREYLIVNNFI